MNWPIRAVTIASKFWWKSRRGHYEHPEKWRIRINADEMRTFVEVLTALYYANFYSSGGNTA